MRSLILGALAALILTVAAGAAEPIAQPPGLVREAISVPFKPEGPHLEAMVTRPAGDGRFPLMVFSHGAPRSADDRPRTHPNTYSAVAVEFARRGWAVASVVRRGYGRSGGAYAETSGPCAHRDYVKSGGASAEDLLATVGFMARQRYVDASRVMLAGISAGGFASIAAAARQPAGLRAVLNFAGGRGSDKPDSVCDADALVAAFGQFGKTVRVPTLFVYAENDHFFGPKLARRFHAAFTQAGAAATFVAVPAIGEDGHALMTDAAVPLWRASVDGFLREHALPTWRSPVAEPAPALKPPPGLSAKSQADFTRYLASSHFEKAFAVDGSGYGWVTGRRTPEEAIHDALERCAKSNRNCRIYAVNERLAR